jgi:uncharacterized protein YukE
MPPFEFPALVRDAASPGAAGSDIAVEPQSLHAAARQLRQAAEALPAAAQRLRVALSTAAGATGGSRSASALSEHADITSAAVGALTERVLAFARALDAGAVRYRGADADAVHPAVSLPSQRRPQ